jgi:hypothetical protein
MEEACSNINSVALNIYSFICSIVVEAIVSEKMNLFRNQHNQIEHLCLLVTREPFFISHWFGAEELNANRLSVDIITRVANRIAEYLDKK